ncbi:glutaredoxin domain-containing protein [Pleionea sp. CnH1-48]|uniref:glutaredoxin domain-containing protein n=1 Tax=Pleionea sp. CnH1-48 TaxID=2954494 RepID=UPI002097D1DB|nr:glutathione S-transferase N-terminal domain-containing protein [Pleionea sp. CnH1-48]MCO7226275.1 glutathione S-transferase N-terminal domain-containing protein [Pleionea sp. CnH1-48]
MAVIRWILGRIILLLNFVFSPRGIKRTKEQQAAIDQQTALLSLYQFEACPFCVKVRRAAKRLSLNLELRDAKNDAVFRQQLEQEGGRIKVPCLRIVDQDNQVKWMYESKDIVAYLNKRFATH